MLHTTCKSGYVYLKLLKVGTDNAYGEQGSVALRTMHMQSFNNDARTCLHCIVWFYATVQNFHTPEFLVVAHQTYGYSTLLPCIVTFLKKVMNTFINHHLIYILEYFDSEQYFFSRC